MPDIQPILGPILLLLRSRKFLLALVACLQTLIFAAQPNFNPQVWQAIDVLLGILISAIAVDSAAVSLAAKK
jgi:hypothetical protein